MKRIYSWGIPFLFLLLLSSCDKWLDVNSELDKNEETLFENAKGYYVALNGLYIKMSASELYGCELSWGAVEAWGRSYTLNEEYYHTGWSQIANFEYEKSDAVRIAENIWLKAYKVIAEANNLIQNLERDDEVLFKYGDVTKNMILGEAYAVRALMHFELLRIFAKAPITDNGGNSSFIPWVTTYPSLVNVPLSTKEILQNIIRDLEKAKEWVKPFDTDAAYPGHACYVGTEVGTRIKLDADVVSSGESEDEFFRYRANRLSYYPITALLARVCLYAGDNSKAFLYANEIVTLINGKKVNYTFIAPGFITAEPRLHSEILFGTYNSLLADWTKLYFEGDVRDRILQLNDLAGIFGTNALDSRLDLVFGNVVMKFSTEVANAEAAKSLIPVLRFPECYYIAAEARFDENKTEAIEIFNQVVKARGNGIYQLDENVDKATFIEAIVQEYRREFLCEGQMVYVYKRLNIPLRANGIAVAHDGKLVLPVPDIEAGV